jgi:hypothetical protein
MSVSSYAICPWKQGMYLEGAVQHNLNELAFLNELVFSYLAAAIAPSQLNDQLYRLECAGTMSGRRVHVTVHV